MRLLLIGFVVLEFMSCKARSDSSKTLTSASSDQNQETSQIELDCKMAGNYICGKVEKCFAPNKEDPLERQRYQLDQVMQRLVHKECLEVYRPEISGYLHETNNKCSENIAVRIVLGAKNAVPRLQFECLTEKKYKDLRFKNDNMLREGSQYSRGIYPYMTIYEPFRQ